MPFFNTRMASFNKNNDENDCPCKGVGWIWPKKCKRCEKIKRWVTTKDY